MELRYRIRTAHSFGKDSVSRMETWTYLVRSIDENQGVYDLEARLDDLDAAISAEGEDISRSELAKAIRAERRRLDSEPLALTLSMDGRMDEVATESWADSMPHRLLALKLPDGPVRVGDRWNDAATARSFSDLLPAEQEVEIAGTEQLEVLSWSALHHPVLHPHHTEQHLDAGIRTGAAVVPRDSDLPAIDIDGLTSWDLDAGVLQSRTLEIRERGGALPIEHGSLRMQLDLVETGP
jgi:hypothetical protein